MAHDMKENCPMCEKGGMCGQHHWMHVIIRIAVAILIFWAGVQFGELKSIIRAEYSNYGYGMMGSYGGQRTQTYYVGGPGMMSNWGYTTASAPTVTTVPSTTTKK